MEWLIWSLYGMLFALGALFPEKNSLISLIIVCFNLVILFVDRNKQDIVLFSSFVLGSEAIAIINMAVYCVFSEKGIVRFNKIKSYQFFAILVLTGIFINTGNYCYICVPENRKKASVGNNKEICNYRTVSHIMYYSKNTFNYTRRCILWDYGKCPLFWELAYYCNICINIY